MFFFLNFESIKNEKNSLYSKKKDIKKNVKKGKKKENFL